MTTPASDLTVGIQCAQNNEYSKAENEFDLLLASDRTDALALYYRGCVRLHLTKYEIAIEDFDSAISLSRLPIDCELAALYKRAFAHQKLHQFDSALHNYKELLNRAKEKQINDLIHKAHFSIGNVYSALNQHERAINHFDNAIKTSGGSCEDKQKLYYLHRGRAHAFCADFQTARNDLDVVIQESEDAFVKGCAYNELGQHDKALQEFDQCLDSNERGENKSSLPAEILHDHIQFRRGLSNAALNYHEHALADYECMLEHSNVYTSSAITDRAFFRKGMSSMALNNLHEALINFNKSISLNDHQSDVFYARGMLHFTLGRHNAAVFDHRHAIELGQSNSISPSIYQTFYQVYNHDRNDLDRLSYQKKLRDAEAALTRCKEKELPTGSQHRQVAEYKQQLAPYTHDPEKTHHSARENIRQAIRDPSSITHTHDEITLAINDLCAAQMLCDKYPAGIASERIVNQFINSAMGGLLEMSEVLEKCAVPRNWEDLTHIFHELSDMSLVKTDNQFNLFRLKVLRVQLKKVAMIRKTSEKFQNCRQQHEFYTMLVIRLCNLFDSTRTATTGIFQHALTGTFTKVSYVPKLLGYLCRFLPVGSDAAKTVVGCLETGAKKLDGIRIQNALTHVGCLDKQEKLHQAADKIAEKITTMYAQQIEWFSTSTDETYPTTENGEREPCFCVKCCRQCCGCFKKSKNQILNERETSNIQTIVQYAFELLVNSLTKLTVSEVNNIADLSDFFVKSICHLAYSPTIYLHIVGTKIQPKDGDQWNTYDFFRRPAIRFEENDVRADKHMDMSKFGCRDPSWEEINWYKNNPDKLDKLGLKKKNEQ